MVETPKILIIDFGGQYTHLISRRIRDLGVLSTTVSFEKASEISQDINGIILSGGPRSVEEENSPRLTQDLEKIILKRKIPTLGICYGHQLLADMFGGKLERNSNREYGKTIVTIKSNSAIIPRQVGQTMRTWMSHGDHVSQIGKGFDLVASSSSCPVVAMQSKDNMIFGVQFHPEVTHTEDGIVVLESFIHKICKMSKTTWSMENYAEILIREMRTKIGSSKIILGVSGGVDSLVAALVLKKAVGNQLHPIFINHGLLRKDEAKFVINMFQNKLEFENFHYVNAGDKFLDELKGVVDPEEKRKIIGHQFIDVFEGESIELSSSVGHFQFLAQGTIYTDRVESGAVGDGTAKIKSHHNLTLPEKMKLEIIEPLKELYKDEVRQLGLVLGAPKKMINRYPFPGPGLAVRILGEVNIERVRILQNADAIFLNLLLNSEFESEVWQAFAVLLQDKAVGVLGDERAYGNIIALRAVQSIDGMTADFSRLSWELLGEVSTQIINSIPEITRVVYDISTKPPSTIEFE